MQNILLVHGFNGKPKIFEYFKNILEEKGFNVISPDFPVRQDITVEGYFAVFEKYKDVFNENLTVIAHSIGNPMFIKYVAKSKCKVDKYISLAGFSKEFYNEGKDVLNEKVELVTLNKDELEEIVNLANKRYSIFSKDDHVVPYSILSEFSDEIKSEAISIDGIGHMGSKSGLEELPEVVEIVINK